MQNVWLLILLSSQRNIGIYGDTSAYWADPDHEDAVGHMRRLAEDTEARRKLAATGKAHIEAFVPTGIPAVLRVHPDVRRVFLEGLGIPMVQRDNAAMRREPPAAPLVTNVRSANIPSPPRFANEKNPTRKIETPKKHHATDFVDFHYHRRRLRMITISCKTFRSTGSTPYITPTWGRFLQRTQMLLPMRCKSFQTSKLFW